MQHKIISIKTDTLIPYAGNSRIHSEEQVNQIAASIKEFGFNNPILTDKDGGIIAGHGRLLAAQKLCLDEVPTICLAHLSDAKRRAYVIADNKLAMNAGWDDDALAAEIARLTEEDFDVGLLGFDDTELAELLGTDETKGKTDQNDIPTAPVLQVTVEGDVWVMGNHRLTCGDSNACDWIKSNNVGCLIFDPPWDAECAKVKPSIQSGSVIAFSDGQRMADVVSMFGAPTWFFVWDCVTSWYAPNRPLKRCKVALWYGSIDDYDTEGSHYGEPGESKQVTNTRGTYEYKANPKGKHLSDVFKQPITQLHSGDVAHPHSKPVDWTRMLIANCSRGDIVDPFAGSGTTVIVAEQLGRRSELCELDPANCDVIVERWQDYTGLEATHATTGATFNSAANGKD